MAQSTHLVSILVLALSLIICTPQMAEAKEVQPAAAFSSACERIFEYFPNCLGFLVGSPNYGRPSRRCCQHVDKLNVLAKHRTGPRTICWCIQIMVKGVTPSVVPSRIQDLPIMCNTALSFPISDSMDCSKVTKAYNDVVHGRFENRYL